MLHPCVQSIWQILQSFPNHDDWTEDETKDLLDALSRVGEEWDVVAQMVRTKSMQQCVLHFARLPIADRYLLDVNPVYEDERLLKMPLCSSQSSSSAPALAPSAFPDEWSPEWTRWLREMVSVDPREAAALGPALAASLAVVDGILDEAVDCGGSDALDPKGGDRQRASIDGAKSAQPCDWDEDARPSADHPWMSVLEWPAPSGLPRTKDRKEGDHLLLLAEEAGKFRRGRVREVHSAKMGIMSVEVCAGHGVKVLQLSCSEYRILTSDEVATIERTIGCSFMDMSAAEKGQQRAAMNSDAVDEVPAVLPVKAIVVPSQAVANGRSNAQVAPQCSSGTVVSDRMVGVTGESQGECEDKDGATGAGCAGHRRQTAEVGIGAHSRASAHWHNVWDVTGAPALRVVEDLPALRQAVECAKEVQDEAQVRDATLKVVQAKIAKTALRLYNAELVLADAVLTRTALAHALPSMPSTSLASARSCLRFFMSPPPLACRMAHRARFILFTRPAQYPTLELC